MSQSTWTSNGTYLHSPPLSEQMRYQSEGMYVFRQFCETKEALGVNAGDAAQFTKQLRIDTRGGTLVETATMPKNRIKWIKDSVTVTEYGNGVNYTQKIESLSEFNIRDQKQRGLVRDQVDVLDREVGSKFTSAEFKAVCSAAGTTVFTVNGTATAVATVNPTTTNMIAIANYAKKKHIPDLNGGYVSILSVEAHGGVYDSLQAIAQYADPDYRFARETGKFYGIRFVEDNSFLSNVIGNGSVLGEGVLFGEEAVCEAVAVAEELRYEETDLGRNKVLAWYAILGFKKTWSLAADDSNSTGLGFERIIHITSA